MCLRRLLLGGSGLGSPDLGRRRHLLGALGATDGADTGNSLLAEVSTVAVLGSVVGDTLVDPRKRGISTARSDADGMCPETPHLLAVGGVRAPSDGVDALSRLLGLARSLGDEDNAALLGGLDTNSL